MVRVKVCGFTHEDDVQAAIEAGVDAVGAIVDVPVETPREVSPETAATLFEGVPPFVSTVLVTMPETVERARDLVETVRPDVVQIHDGLTPQEVATLSETGVGTIASVNHDEPVIEDYARDADAILVDSTAETGAGGTGRTHDWSATREFHALDTPLILAGGLTPDNVEEAVTTVDPYAVDVASGVEGEPGRKDASMVRKFVDRAQTGAVE
ncbi:MAG: phosphoribosylanthranilate isomerase [Halodesulfurarchaeum sp.]|nr:phosphoribosylanthranilate isomerase [Halodesulfurarchaeum sp.]